MSGAYGHDFITPSEPDPIDMMEHDIKTLTRERDEARADAKAMSEALEVATGRANLYVRNSDEARREVERLREALVLITHWRGDLIDHEAGARNPREIAQDALAPDASTTTSQPATTTRPSGEDVASGGESEASQ